MHRAALDRLASVLMEQETVDGSAVLNSLRDEQAAPDTDGRGELLPLAPMARQQQLCLARNHRPRCRAAKADEQPIVAV